MTGSQRQYHTFGLLLFGMSASAWGITSFSYIIPIAWCVALTGWILTNTSHDIPRLGKQFTRLIIGLSIIAFFQLLFFRRGVVVFSIGNFPVLFSDGIREAVLLWIRFLMLLLIGLMLSNISTFRFLSFLNKIRVPFRFSMLLVSTIKLIPFALKEALRAYNFLQFRGIQFRKLSLRNKWQAMKKILYGVLMRSLQYTSISAHALELRGYGYTGHVRLQTSYPLCRHDYLLIAATLILNAGSFVWLIG